MSSHRPRDYSPTRYYAEQPRATTGNVYVTSFDTSPKAGGSSYTSSSQSRGSVTTVPPARHHSVAYEAQPMRKSTLNDGKTKTEYAVRPRNASFNPSDSKRPLSITTGNSSPPRRGTMVMASPRELTPTVRDSASRFLQPASSHSHHHGPHHRHNSTSSADFGSRDAGKDTRANPDFRRAPYVQRAYHDSRPPARSSDDEGWSYTGPREQFNRDYPQYPPEPRESTSRRERHTGYYDNNRPHDKRETIPAPSSNRHLGRRDRVSPEVHGARTGFESDPDRGAEVTRRRNSTRQPVLHQQLLRDDGYSSNRDEYETRGHSGHRSSRHDQDVRPRDRQRTNGREPERDREYDRKYHRDSERERPRDHDRERPRDHEQEYDRSDYDRDYNREDRPKEGRRRPTSRDSSPERSGLKALAKTALSGLAAAGVVKGLERDQREKEPDSDDGEEKEKRHKKHRRRSHRDDTREEPEPDEERYKEDRQRSRRQEGSSSETPDDQPSRRRHSRRRHIEDEDASSKLALQDTPSDRRGSKVRAREPEDPPTDADRTSRELVPAHNQDQGTGSLESRTISPGENEDDRPRRVQLVEPVKEKEDVKPKGILKPTRQVPFPEDPNPIREGVAPLKDATKDGIPVNARWTKINRLLVNPEALEKYHERFEERDDYVIVLRVLTREEIKKFADKTKEIREAREREWQQKLEERRRRKNGHESESTYSDGEIDYDGDENGPRPQLAIEAAPPAPPANFHSLPHESNQRVPARGMPGGLPAQDNNVEANYSQNV